MKIENLDQIRELIVKYEKKQENLKDIKKLIQEIKNEKNINIITKSSHIVSSSMLNYENSLKIISSNIESDYKKIIFLDSLRKIVESELKDLEKKISDL
ncbi:hypothetical protein C4N15_07210 [Fusobacterium necrophorum subsp. funduliforme]|uniref:hypothetical protein n=1 Tax=Fusobacterium necrophorum TaxID=859 RepID=UPI000245DAED|nr:hypothetical protein [Fusobacterium necrophorum]AVQ21445.1 hypothetical protein C4N15_07210 [Fusobacterium necrophorum subsp. funduliforme]EHO19664.1 hypothetical protein HMPREF9466_01595 [Fusobacterium necrophorum subsp. funduliforme 1_1_36S]